MKKILVTAREYPPSVSGPSIYISNILNRIKKHSFLVFTINKGLTKDNITVKCKKFTNIRYLNAFLYIFHSVNFSLDKDFDYIIGNDFVGSIAGMFVSIIKRKPLISIFHNITYETAESFNILLSFRRFLLRTIFKKSKIIVSAPPRVKKDIVELFGEYEKKIVIIPYGVNIPTFKKINKPDANVILFVGCLYGNKKGAHYLVRAFADVLKEIKNCELWFVGPLINKKYVSHLKDIGREFGMLNKIKFFGKISHTNNPENVFSYFDVCDVFCLSSFSKAETFGIPCMEAAKMGKPVVATIILEENGVVINEKTGLVVPIKDSKNLAKALIRLLKDEKLRKNMGKEGKELAKNFDWNESAKKFEVILDEI